MRFKTEQSTPQKKHSVFFGFGFPLNQPQTIEPRPFDSHVTRGRSRACENVPRRELQKLPYDEKKEGEVKAPSYAPRYRILIQQQLVRMEIHKKTQGAQSFIEPSGSFSLLLCFGIGLVFLGRNWVAEGRQKIVDSYSECV